MSNYLPEELVMDVLARLPVKTLKRFKCVSKQWCALIESREFIEMHLNQSSLRVLVGTAQAAQDSPKLPERFRLWAAEEFGSLENFYPTREELCFPLQDFPDRKSKKKDGRIKVVGSCNGLVCIRYSKYGVLVWNPWINKHWIIPRTRVETELSLGCRRMLPYSAFEYGFGYDEVNDDYKVVRIVQLLDIGWGPLGCEVKVFSMKSNVWRRIEDFPYTSFRKDFPLGAAGVLANGALHWLLSNFESNPPNSIVAINLTTEEHQLLPEPGFGRSQFVHNYGVLNGYLCLFADKMWLMQEYGMEDSWRELDLELPEDISFHSLKPIAYSASEKNLIFQWSSHELMWYNEDTSIQSVHLSASPDLVFCDMFCTVASLVEPNCGGKKKFRGTREDLKRRDVSLKRCSSLENRRPKKRGRILVASC